MVSSFSFLYPPTPVNHVSKMWPGNSFQLQYIIISGVNIGSILTISQSGMYVRMYGKLIELLFLGFLVDYDTRYLSSLPILTQFAVKMLYFVTALYFLMCTNEIRNGNVRTEDCQSSWYAHPSQSPPLPTTAFSDLGTAHKALIFILE